MDAMTNDQPATPVRIVRDFAAPASRVFAAWTDPQQLGRWAWGSLGRDCTAEIDLRVGGRYRVTTSRPEGELAFSGTYIEVKPDERLVYTLHWEAPMGYDVREETVTVEFVDTALGSEVIFVHDGVELPEARREHAKGWADTFDSLKRLLAE